jgi:Ca2+-transporting ATPase
VDRWHNLSAEEVLRNLDTSRSGLSRDAARERLLEYGLNELEKKGKTPRIALFLRQFASPLIYILLAAAVIELAALQEPADALVILFVVLANAIIGFVQESRAEGAMEALEHLTVPQARVVRQGASNRIPASQLVPGDIVPLEAGEKIPADGRLIETIDLSTDESILTGESVPVQKFVSPIEGEATVADMGNMVHMGCAVVNGKGLAVVAATGMNTEVGKITAQVQGVKPPPTPLQQNVARWGRYLGILVVSLIVLFFVLGLARGYSFRELITVSIAAAVSAIPEGLPVMVTVVLALGMRRMAQRHALIRKLPAVETMGAVTVICSDKTGTLTESEMTLRQIRLANGSTIEITGAGYNPQGEFIENGRQLEPQKDGDLSLALRISVLCNDSSLKSEDTTYQLLGDPTEGALLVAAMKGGVNPQALHNEHPRLAELPFESAKRYMATLHRYKNGTTVAYVKGSVDRVLSMSRYVQEGGITQEMTEQRKQAIERMNLEMASKALRVMALAYTECPDGCPEGLSHERLDGALKLVALAGIIDPPREEAKQAVASCKRAGIKVVMITGDQEATAVAVAEEIGLPIAGAVTGLELGRMTDNELDARIDSIHVFARVEPLNKLRIVEAFKSKGYRVAMTGDGVNDGPALRAADIGISMGIKGTDVAREASDMVLTDDNFASIVAAVEEGRAIFRNIRRSVFFLLSTSAGELLLLTTAILAGLPFPVAAVQILWVNLVTDGVCTIPLGLEPKHRDVLDEPPRRLKAGLVYRGMLARIFFIAVFIALGAFFVFWWAHETLSLDKARTIAFCILVVSQWFNALNARSDQQSLFRIGVFSNRWLVAGIGLALLLQITVVYAPPFHQLFHTVPLSPTDWALVALVSASVFVAEEVRKAIAPRLFSRGK